MANAKRDANYITTLIGVSSIDLETPQVVAVNPATGAMLIDGTSLYATLDTRYLMLDASNDPITGDLTIKRTGDDNAFLYLDEYSTDHDRYGRLYFRKSGNAAVIAETEDGDFLGNLKYLGVNDSSQFAGGAYMSVEQTGASGEYVPTRMEWATYSADAVNNDQFVMNSDGTIDTSSDLTVGGDLTITGDDLFMNTNTANYFLMADGTNYNPTSPASARTGMGVAIGSDVQAWDDDLDDIAALTPTDGNFIVGNGTDWVAESGATVRTSLGLDAGGAGDIWVEKAGDTMTGALVITPTANGTQILSITQADTTAVFDVDTTNRKIVVTSGTTGQSTIGAGLIVNNDSGNGAINDFKVNTANLIAITVDASADTMTFGVPIALSGALTLGDSIVSDTDSTDDLGDSTHYWANIYVDKVYLDADSTIINTDVDGWNAHLTSDGSDHTFIDQSVISGATPTFTGTNITGVPAASILAGTFGSGEFLFQDKVKFTQTDGDEYIDSLADGYMDYGATTGHRFDADVTITGNNLTLGDGSAGDPRITADSGNDAYIEWQEDELQWHIDGALEMGGDWTFVGGSFFPKTIDDADPDSNVAGTEGEIVYNLNNNKFTGCTVTGAAGSATWVAFH